jgi:hypothetical protein
MLPHDLHADGALPRDHLRIVVGVHEDEAAPSADALRLLVRVRISVAVELHFGAACLHGVDLDARRRHWHHDHGPAAQALRRERHALRMVAGARRDHATAQARLGQPGHLVVGAAQLEREDRLQVLALDEERVAHPARQRARRLEGCLGGHVVDSRLEDSRQVIDALHDQNLA